MKKYKVNTRRLLYWFASVLVYAAISLYASVGLGNNVARGVAIHLVLSGLTAVTVLFVLFNPVDKKDANEKTQTPS